MAEDKELENSLGGYKKSIAAENRATIEIDRNLIFTGRTQRGYEVDFDAEVQWGCMPTESLMLSLGGCLSIDMVSFLRKMRCTVTGFKIDLSGERNTEPPQYYKAIHMDVYIKGRGLTEGKVQRAVSLSQDKYCSVHHSLRPDMKITVQCHITDDPDGEDTIKEGPPGT